MESWGLNTAGIPNIHKNLAVQYFTFKHTIFGIPEAIKSLQTSKLSTAQFFRRTRAVHLLPTIPLQVQSISSDVFYVCALLIHEVWMIYVL